MCVCVCVCCTQSKSFSLNSFAFERIYYDGVCCRSLLGGRCINIVNINCIKRGCANARTHNNWMHVSKKRREAKRFTLKSVNKRSNDSLSLSRLYYSKWSEIIYYANAALIMFDDGDGIFLIEWFIKMYVSRRWQRRRTYAYIFTTAVCVCVFVLTWIMNNRKMKEREQTGEGKRKKEKRRMKTAVKTRYMFVRHSRKWIHTHPVKCMKCYV